MTTLFPILLFGFFLGMRHATDSDHVVAVTTIVSRQRRISSAAWTGVFWGIGHSLTLLAVGGAQRRVLELKIDDESRPIGHLIRSS